jgi:hypothetical protein
MGMICDVCDDISKSEKALKKLDGGFLLSPDYYFVSVIDRQQQLSK